MSKYDMKNESIKYFISVFKDVMEKKRGDTQIWICEHNLLVFVTKKLRQNKNITEDDIFKFMCAHSRKGAIWISRIVKYAIDGWNRSDYVTIDNDDMNKMINEAPHCVPDDKYTISIVKGFVNDVLRHINGIIFESPYKVYYTKSFLMRHVYSHFIAIKRKCIMKNLGKKYKELAHDHLPDTTFYNLYNFYHKEFTVLSDLIVENVI